MDGPVNFPLTCRAELADMRAIQLGFKALLSFGQVSRSTPGKRRGKLGEARAPTLRGPFPVQSLQEGRSAGEHADRFRSAYARPPRMGDAEAASRAGRRGAAAAAGMRVFSPEYYALCAGGGMLAAGATHLAITPLDVLKVNMQVSEWILLGWSSAQVAVLRRRRAAPWSGENLIWGR